MFYTAVLRGVEVNDYAWIRNCLSSGTGGGGWRRKEYKVDSFSFIEREEILWLL